MSSPNREFLQAEGFSRRFRECTPLRANLDSWRHAVTANALLQFLEGVNSGYALPDDQGVNVVCTFIGFYRLQVGHVAEDRVFIRDAVCAKDVAGHASAFQRH